MKNFMIFLNALSECMDEINTGEEPEQRIEVPSAQEIQEDIFYGLSVLSMVSFAYSAITSPDNISFSNVLSVINSSSIVIGKNLSTVASNLSHISTVKTSLTYGAYVTNFFAPIQEYVDEVDLPKNLVKNLSSLIV